MQLGFSELRHLLFLSVYECLVISLKIKVLNHEKYKNPLKFKVWLLHKEHITVVRNIFVKEI